MQHNASTSQQSFKNVPLSRQRLPFAISMKKRPFRRKKRFSSHRDHSEPGPEILTPRTIALHPSEITLSVGAQTVPLIGASNGTS